MEETGGQETGERRAWRRPLLGGLVVVVALVGVGAVWYVRSSDDVPVGAERAVTVEVDECGVVSLDIGRQTWSTMGAGPTDVVRTYGRGPEPGVLRRHTADEATFVSDLVDGSVPLQRHGREVFRTLGCAIMP